MYLNASGTGFGDATEGSGVQFTAQNVPDGWTVAWPNGTETVLNDVFADQSLTITAPEYLFISGFENRAQTEPEL